MTNFRFLKTERTPRAKVVELLNNNVIGTPGHGMLYQHLGVNDKIFSIADPYFVNLMRGDDVMGTCCFCGRTTSNAGYNIRSFYVRYFAFKDAYRRKSIMPRTHAASGVVRKEIKSVLQGEAFDEGSNEKFFHYAYVDPRNLRSTMLCEEFGFEKVREYTTLIFSRMRPVDRGDVVEASVTDVPVIKALLTGFYKDFTTFSFDNLFAGVKYYFIKNADGRILAGVQANPDRWKIHSLPGLSGKIILNVFSQLPFVNKLINKDYRFLTFEGIYYAPGYEHYLEWLFESLLARYNLNSAIAVVDPGTDLYKTLRSLKLGLADKLNKEVRGSVICKFVNFTDADADVFRVKPAYISGIDVT